MSAEGIWGWLSAAKHQQWSQGLYYTCPPGAIAASRGMSREVPSGLGLGHTFHTEPGTETLEEHEPRVMTGRLLRRKSRCGRQNDGEWKFGSRNSRRPPGSGPGRSRSCR